jgi:hypothetical protein
MINSIALQLLIHDDPQKNYDAKQICTQFEEEYDVNEAAVSISR